MATITATGDLNGDGHGDLLARESSGNLWLYPGTGHGTFSTRTSLGGGWKSMNALTAPGDLNSDGHGDLIARDTSGKLWLYPGTGRGSFGTRKLIGSSGWELMSTFLSVGDVDGDGQLDLVAATQELVREPPRRADGGPAAAVPGQRQRLPRQVPAGAPELVRPQRRLLNTDCTNSRAGLIPVTRST